MSQFFISCKESRIENNRSFYGCFYLGPFEPSQSITIANTLRRTLLSEIYGLAIVSVEIEGALHEYSSLPGVRESVLDILLNLKEIVLKKTVKNFTPQIGYLRARGPGVVSAAHLKLPPFIQCVDPDQYIANLSHNGFLNMKFIIQYGNKWLSPVTSIFQTSTPPFRRTTEGCSSREEATLREFSEEVSNASTIEEGKKIERSVKEGLKDGKTRLPMTYNVFNLYFKKRRLFLKKLKEIGCEATESNSYINMFSKNFNFLFKSKKKRDIVLKRKTKESLNLILKISRKYPGINLKNGPLSAKLYFGLVSSKNKALPSRLVDGRKQTLEILKKQVKSLNKVNNKITSKASLIPVEEVKEETSVPATQQSSMSIDNSGKQQETKVLAIDSQPNFNRQLIKSNAKLNKKKLFFNINPLNIEAIFNPISKVNYIIEINDLKIAQTKMQNSFKSSELYETLQNISWLNSKTPFTHFYPPVGGGNEVSHEVLLWRTPLSPKVGQEVSNQKMEKGVPTQRFDSKEASLFNIMENSMENKIINKDFENLLQLNHEISALTKETIKHNIILEIWTNGSIHPRDALFQAFKNIIKIFAKLKKVQPFSLNTASLNFNSTISQKSNEELTIDSVTSTIGVKESYFPTKEAEAFTGSPVGLRQATSLLGNRENIVFLPYHKVVTEFHKVSNQKEKSQFLLKKIKMRQLQSTFLQDFQPLNEICFLSTYINPKIKNYYLNKRNLSILLKTAIETNFVEPIYIPKKIVPQNLTAFE